ncbi:MAG: TolC family protein [Melioribacteraceae bacterium]|nr:TolC family protein [Melioribacteraceae bacterium]
MRKTLLVLILVVAASSIYGQEKLTLKESISIALQRNSALIKTKNNLVTSEAGVKSAYGNFLPDFGVSGGWGWTRIADDGTTQTDFLGNKVITPSSEVDSRSFSVRAGGGITLFDGLANYANLSKSKNNLEAAKLDISKLKQDIVYLTVSYYYDIIYKMNLLTVRDDDVKYNQKFLETVQERNKLGSVAVADVYAQQVRTGNAELLRIQAQNSYENAKNSLLNYLALDVMEEYEFIDPLKNKLNTDEYMSEFDDLSRLVNSAMHKRLDFQSEKLNLESAEESITIANSGLFPSLTGSYSFSTNSNTMDDLFNRNVYSAGLSLNIPIFSNWNTEYQIQASKAYHKNVQEDLNALERQIKIEVKQGYLDLQAAKKQVDVSSKNVKSAFENRRVNQERYSLGSGTILDVLQSDKDYQQAVTDNLNSIFQFYLFKDRLQNYLGDLDYKIYE